MAVDGACEAAAKHAGADKSKLKVENGAAGEDRDAVKDVQDSVAHRSKLLLMQRFNFGVAAYIIMTAGVLLLPMFVGTNSGTIAVRIWLVGQNAVLWLFLAVMCWIFR